MNLCAKCQTYYNYKMWYQRCDDNGKCDQKTYETDGTTILALRTFLINQKNQTFKEFYEAIVDEKNESQIAALEQKVKNWLAESNIK